MVNFIEATHNLFQIQQKRIKELENAAKHIIDNNVPIEQIITHKFNLKEIAQAYEIFENGEVFVNSSKFYIPNINDGVNFKNETFIIPDNEIFVLGDNRPNSQDSRYIGTIPIGNIIGKASYLIYPFENFKKLDDRR